MHEYPNRAAIGIPAYLIYRNGYYLIAFFSIFKQELSSVS